MVYHLWDSTILGCHKEGVYADESVVVIARSPGDSFNCFTSTISGYLSSLERYF